jgi:serine/threonine protein phosphatase PrpC
MALLRFDFGPDGIQFSSAGVGNIEARLCKGSACEHLLARRGILGGNAPSPRVTKHRWHAGQVLVLHSDGLTQRWRWQDFADLGQQPATTIAQRLLRALAKTDDDATVVVVRDMARAR